ncbi:MULTISPECIES: hypothetical protein [unclassified Roseibium]|uniref:hypothetical protein n=1 Tax=unclassified Roseibium TaxID=2629323 RepID=UPI0031777A7D
MSTETTDGKLSRTRRETAESKAETTKRISQEILQAEVDLREAKTNKLRAARLAMQADQPAPEPAGKTKKRKRSAS